MEPLMKQFLDQEATPYVRKLLRDSISVRSSSEMRKRFEFNCFEILLDFESNTVLIEDVMDVGPSGTLRVDMAEFAKCL